MPTTEPQQPTVLERYGMAQLRRWNPRATWAVRPLAAGELESLRRLERRTLFGAAIAGIISGSILGGAEVLWAGRMGDLSLRMSREQWEYWGLFVALIVVVSALEILFLYWNAIWSAGRISALAGVQLAQHETGESVARALVRAALELPNPREPVYGVDPYARTPRWKLTLLALGYKVKVGMTSFLLKVLLRRLLGRAALRFFIPLIAIPVYATWNTLVTAWVLRQARVRAFGPLAIHDLTQYLTVARSSLSAQCRRLIGQGVAEAIVRTGTAHPNYHLLMGRLLEVLGVSSQELKVEWDSARSAVAGLPEAERRMLLTVLVVAAIIDGRVRQPELALLEEAHHLCRRPFDPENVFRKLRAFLHGQGIREEKDADAASPAADRGVAH